MKTPTPSVKILLFLCITILSFFLYIHVYYIQREICTTKIYLASSELGSEVVPRGSEIIRKCINEHSSKKTTPTHSRHLLTLFTTWRESQEKETVIFNTIRNWKSFEPYIANIVFTEILGHYHEVAMKNKWKVMTPQTATNENIPILKDMFAQAKKKMNSEFYGYANSDVLFTPLLVQTLHSVLKFLRRENVNVLVVGQRTDISLVNMTDSDNITHVLNSGKKNGKLHHPNAVDYFITTPDFPFDDLPNVVIGRPAYDNYVIMHARAHQVPVIDSTETNLALHQSTEAGDHEGLTHKNHYYNFRILKRDDFDSGYVTCSNFQTKFSNISSDPIKVFKRRQKPTYCSKMFESW